MEYALSWQHFSFLLLNLSEFVEVLSDILKRQKYFHVAVCSKA